MDGEAVDVDGDEKGMNGEAVDGDGDGDGDGRIDRGRVDGAGDTFDADAFLYGLKGYELNEVVVGAGAGELVI